ncbi:hypothetical protein K474DRAFT_1658849 [Panus rudis PR-1116 ss-1]|nr:hypothetical protein K474DRAFT_1658849 [Panus rudis PR-1116 ss-1]
MNPRPDMIRQQGLSHLSPNPLNMSPSFMLPQQQQPQPTSQSSQPFPQSNHPVPSVGVFSGVPPPAVPSSSAYHLSAQQRANQQRMFAQQAPGMQHINGPTMPSPAPLNGMSQSQLQPMPFPGQPMPQQSVRRVQSQPQPLNGLQMGQPAVGTVAGIPNMFSNISLNSGSIPSQARQGPHPPQPGQSQNMRLPQQVPNLAGQGQGSDITLLGRPSIQSNPGILPHVPRAPSSQVPLMNNLAPPSIASQSHSAGLPPHQQSFQSMSLNMSHQTPQMMASPHIPQSHPHPGIPPAAGNLSHGAGGAGNHRTPENNVFNFGSPLPQGPPRLPSRNGPFPFMPSSSSSPRLQSDLPSSVSVGPPNGQISTARSGLMTTPAQAFEQMSHGATDGLTIPSSTVQLASSPSRPSSQHALHSSFQMSSQQSQIQSHTPSQARASPQQNILNHRSHDGRPHSQPQVPQMTHPRTPHDTQPSLPATPTLHTRTQTPTSAQTFQNAQQQSGNQEQSHNQAWNVQPSLASNPASLVVAQHGEGPSQTLTSVIPQPTYTQTIKDVLGKGQGISRLLQFSGELADDNKDKLQLPFWQAFVDRYFTTKAILKFTLWKDNQKSEAKPFEIGLRILPRFFLVTSQSGVKSMNLSLDGARERLITPTHASIECTQAVWTFRYVNGYIVTLRGPLMAHVHVVTAMASPRQPQMPLKFESFSFDATLHDKFISVDAIDGTRLADSPPPSRPPDPTITSVSGVERVSRGAEDVDRQEPKVYFDRATIPAEPVNAFGIPQATMRCLELAESVAQMQDLLDFSRSHQLGPLDALEQYAKILRESQGGLISGYGVAQPMASSGEQVDDSGHNAHSDGGSATGESPQSTYTGGPKPHPNASAAATSQATDGTPKQSKATPAQGASTPNSGPASATTPAPASTPSASTSTPSLASATLKRKAQNTEAASPTMGGDQGPPAKRAQRKRGKTQGG